MKTGKISPRITFTSTNPYFISFTAPLSIWIFIMWSESFIRSSITS